MNNKIDPAAVASPPRRTPIQAIRAYCLFCSNRQPKEVRLCTIPDCALYPYRFGKRPKAEASDDI